MKVLDKLIIDMLTDISQMKNSEMKYDVIIRAKILNETDETFVDEIREGLDNLTKWMLELKLQIVREKK